MIGFVALRWADDDAISHDRVLALRRSLVAIGWQVAIDAPGWLLLNRSAANGPAIVRPFGDHRFLVGHAFDSAAATTGAVAPAPGLGKGSFEAACKRFATVAWGAYVIIETDPGDPAKLAIFRDPIGRLDCVHWSSRSLTIVTSDPDPLLDFVPPAGLAIDWLSIPGILQFPGSACETLSFLGIEAIPSGTLVRLGPGRFPAVRIWSAAERARTIVSDRDALREWPALIEGCVRAWATTACRAVAEISGGLDSAIVAAALPTAAGAPMVGWFNYYAPDREGDERAFAYAVAEHLGFDLTIEPSRPPTLDHALLDQLPVSLRPNIAGVSLFHDQHLAASAAALGADTLFTGQGGDALFYQFPTASLASDLFRGRRPLAERFAMLETLAAWQNRSIWSLAMIAFREVLLGAPDLMPSLPIDLVDRTVERAPPPRRWLDDAESLPASKRLQILSLSAARSTFSGAWSANAMTICHPLLSQPLIDYVLPIPPLELTEARRDRALIRNAYAGRLPAKLLDRRGKGSVTQYYGRAVVAAVPFLRTYLLDGCLAGEGLIDCDRLDAILDPEPLMLHDSYTELLTLLLMERWVRGWASRIASVKAHQPATHC